jgi:hypothetical protein
MAEPLQQLGAWIEAGEPALWVVGGVVLVCFLLFNTLRILLYVPQLATCLRDERGCPTINLLTWTSWIVANASTGLYMWMFQGDGWGLVLNLGNALMCAATVAVTLVKRGRSAERDARARPFGGVQH